MPVGGQLVKSGASMSNGTVPLEAPLLYWADPVSSGYVAHPETEGDRGEKWY
jgi:hypothetical protein